jgi:hypothetical protein
MCSQLVLLTCTGPRGHHVIHGNLEEIDERTALVLSEKPVAKGTRLAIVCGLNRLRGVVEACLHDPLGFFIEVDLDFGSRWSQEWFTPEHLLTMLSKEPPKVFTRKIASGY